MALKSRTWACDACDGQFTLLMDDRDPPPVDCQVCGAYMGAGPIPIPNFSFTRANSHGARSKSPDLVYRQMESSSIARAQEAADVAGISASEMSSIKITNMKDNIREGETSVISSTPKGMDTTPIGRAPTNAVLDSQRGAATAAMTMQGSAAGHHGNSARESLTSGHMQRARAMTRAGQMGSHSGAK